MRPHRTDGISLSFGLLFLLVAAWWAIAQVVTVRLPAAGWLVAGALIMFGAIGLLGAIRSGRRTEVPAPVPAEAQVETPGGLPPELHADIVRELLDNPADRVDLHPAYLRHPVAEAPRPASAPPAATSPAPAFPGSGTPAAAGTPDDAGTTDGTGTTDVPGTADWAEDEPTAAVPTAPGHPEAAGQAEAIGNDATAEVTRVDHGHDGDPDDATRRG